MTDPGHSGDDRDRGAILLLVLAVAIVFSLIVLALANFVAADLRYSQIIDARAKTLSSAESGIDYAVDRLRLNQTLCATAAAASGEVSLNGTNTGPVGTALPQALNGTNTKVTCERLDHPIDGPIAAEAGWSAVLIDPADPIDVNTAQTVTIGGPTYLPDPTLTGLSGGSRVRVDDGDLWYTKSDCQPPSSNYSNSFLALQNLDVAPSSARGGICTPRTPLTVFPEPLPASVPAVPDSPPPVIDSNGCWVYSPGRYTNFFPIGANNYFQSGEYLMAFPGEGTIINAVIWAGGADPSDPAPLTANVPCEPARDADIASSGRGATIYFEAGTSLKIRGGGALEVFGRRQGNHVVSIQALGTPAFDPPLITTTSTGSAELVTHGLVWAPYNRVVLDNSHVDSTSRFLGGMVVGRLHLDDVRIAEFEVRPASSAVDTRVLLRSTSTINGGSTTVEAVVAYRPHAADLDDRVAVSSFRVVG